MVIDMDGNNTRIFEGIYTANEKKYHLNVRIYKRLVVFGLAISLLHDGVGKNLSLD